MEAAAVQPQRPGLVQPKLLTPPLGHAGESPSLGTFLSSRPAVVESLQRWRSDRAEAALMGWVENISSPILPMRACNGWNTAPSKDSTAEQT